VPIETEWLEAKSAVPGLDQLGIRATAIRMYTHLVPGITNVTDRARYFAIHPFAIDYWARHVGTNDATAFREFLRKLECVLAIGERLRVYGSGDESYGVVGRIRIDRWFKTQPDPLTHDYAVPIETLQQEYFANGWGSFGQYYSGSEAELGIIRWDDDFPIPKLPPIGQRLAKAFAAVADKCDLPAVVTSKSNPRLSVLKNIGLKARFDSLSPAEVRILREMFLDVSEQYQDAGLRRRKTCLLLLSIADQVKKPIQDVRAALTAAALHKRCEKDVPYNCPPLLIDHFALWATYSLQELLAFALEVLLATAVEVLQELEVSRTRVPRTVTDLAQHCVDLLPPAATRRIVGDLVSQSMLQFSDPCLDPASDSWEEETLRETARSAFYERHFANAIQTSFKLLMRIYSRLPHADPYAQFSSGKLEIDNDRYGLRDLQIFVEKHKASAARDALNELLITVLNLHLRVATAKLAYNYDFTYKFVREGDRLRKIQSVDPALSSPRLQQAAQILADIELLDRSEKAFTLTSDGKAVLRQFGC
jgi:hypothetical protein